MLLFSACVLLAGRAKWAVADLESSHFTFTPRFSELLFLAWCRLPWQSLKARRRQEDTFACHSRETEALICRSVCDVPAENEPAEEIKKKTHIRGAACIWQSSGFAWVPQRATKFNTRTAGSHTYDAKKKQKKSLKENQNQTSNYKQIIDVAKESQENKNCYHCNTKTNHFHAKSASWHF